MLRKHKTTIKVCAFILTFKIALADVVYAAPLEQLSAGVSPQQTILQDPARLEAPLDFTTLKDVYKGSKNKLIIHVQDAHSNYSGQQNLAGALDELMKKYKIKLVLVEGGTKDDTLTALKAIAPTDVWKRVAKKFLMEGKIAGEEYLNLTSDHPMKIMGIEDRELYMKSLTAYSELAEKREAILLNLKRVRIGIEKIKNRVYPEMLKEYEKVRSSDDKGFDVLLRSAKGQDLVDYPEIQKLKHIKDEEASIDFNAANLEQAALVEEISKRGGKESLRSALSKVGRSKDSKLSQLNFLGMLFRSANESNIVLGNYPDLVAYQGYLQQFGAIDFEKLLDEQERFEDQVYLANLGSREALLVRSIDRYLGLLESAYRIQMTTKEFEMFRINEPDFSTQAYLAFINRKLAELGYFDDLIAYESIFEDAKGSLEEFYRSVSERDEAFIKNTERTMTEDKQDVAVLIAGGYHTQHLQRLFIGKGYSYAVLTPHVTSETNQEKYEKVLLEPIESSYQATRSPGHQKDLSVSGDAVTGGSDGIRALPLMESGARLSSVAAYVEPDADKRAFASLSAGVGARLSTYLKGASDVHQGAHFHSRVIRVPKGKNYVEKIPNNADVIDSVHLAYENLGGLVIPFTIVRGDGFVVRMDLARSLEDVIREKIQEDKKAEAINLLKDFFEVNMAMLRRGIVNWDPKIENYGVTDDGRVVLVDIGGLVTSKSILEIPVDELDGTGSSDIFYFHTKLNEGVPQNVGAEFGELSKEYHLSNGGEIYETIKALSGTEAPVKVERIAGARLSVPVGTDVGSIRDYLNTHLTTEVAIVGTRDGRIESLEGSSFEVDIPDELDAEFKINPPLFVMHTHVPDHLARDLNEWFPSPIDFSKSGYPGTARYLYVKPSQRAGSIREGSNVIRYGTATQLSSVDLKAVSGRSVMMVWRGDDVASTVELKDKLGEPISLSRSFSNGRWMSFVDSLTPIGKTADQFVRELRKGDSSKIAIVDVQGNWLMWDRSVTLDSVLSSGARLALNGESKLIPRISKELDLAFKMHSVWPRAIVGFGSARSKPGDPNYELARRFGYEAGKRGFSVITGAGPGIMEAFLAGYVVGRDERIPESYRWIVQMARKFALKLMRFMPRQVFKTFPDITQGVKIEMKNGSESFEQNINGFAESVISQEHFITRKFGLYGNAEAYFVFPGGIGTADEMFDAWKRSQKTGAPLVFVGKEYWQPRLDVYFKQWQEAGLMNQVKRRGGFVITDDPDEAFDAVTKASKARPIMVSDEKMQNMKSEVVASLKKISSLPRAVTVIGRPRKKSPILSELEKLTRMLTADGTNVRAANRGPVLETIVKAVPEAQLGRVQAVMNISEADDLTPNEQKIRERSIYIGDESNHQLVMSANSHLYIVLPGAVGTMSKLWDLVTIMQTSKMTSKPTTNKPIILMGRKFWDPIMEDTFTSMERAGMVSEGDRKLLTVVDTAEEAYSVIRAKLGESVTGARLAETTSTKVEPFGMVSRKIVDFLSSQRIRSGVLRSGDRVGAYTIVGNLGRGDAGTVYEAKDDKGRRYAIKTSTRHGGWFRLNPIDSMRTIANHQSLQNEIRSLVWLQNKLDPKVHEGRFAVYRASGALSDRTSYIVTDLIEGRTLRDILKDLDGQGLPRDRASKIAIGILDALREAHGTGLVHHDIKPDNIIVTEDPSEEHIRLVDLGIATIGEAFHAVYPKDYAPPEARLYAKSDARSDLYQVGLIYFELLTGKKLYDHKLPYDLDRIKDEDIVRTAQLPEALRIFLIKALQEDPSRRFNSAQDMKMGLESALGRAAWDRVKGDDKDSAGEIFEPEAGARLAEAGATAVFKVMRSAQIRYKRDIAVTLPDDTWKKLEYSRNQGALLIRSLSAPEIRLSIRETDTGHVTLTYSNEKLGVQRAQDMEWDAGRKSRHLTLDRTEMGQIFLDAITGIPSEFGPARAAAIRAHILSLDSQGLAVRILGAHHAGLGGSHSISVPGDIRNGIMLVRMYSEKKRDRRFLLFQDRLNEELYYVLETDTKGRVIDTMTGQALPARVVSASGAMEYYLSEWPDAAAFFQRVSRKLKISRKELQNTSLMFKAYADEPLGLGFSRDHEFTYIKVDKVTAPSPTGTKGAARQKTSQGSERGGWVTYPTYIFDTSIEGLEPIEPSAALSSLSADRDILLLPEEITAPYIGYFQDGEYRYFKKLDGSLPIPDGSVRVYRRISEQDPRLVLKVQMVDDKRFTIEGFRWLDGPLKGENVLFGGYINLTTLTMKYGSSVLSVEPRAADAFSHDALKGGYRVPRLTLDEVGQPMIKGGEVRTIPEPKILQEEAFGESLRLAAMTASAPVLVPVSKQTIASTDQAFEYWKMSDGSARIVILNPSTKEPLIMREGQEVLLKTLSVANDIRLDLYQVGESLVLKHNERVIGFIYFWVRMSSADWEAHSEHIANPKDDAVLGGWMVDPDHQKLGLTRVLIDSYFEKFISAGLSDIYHTYIVPLPSLAYQLDSYGFEPKTDVKPVFEYKHGLGQIVGYDSIEHDLPVKAVVKNGEGRMKVYFENPFDQAWFMKWVRDHGRAEIYDYVDAPPDGGRTVYIASAYRLSDEKKAELIKRFGQASQSTGARLSDGSGPSELSVPTLENLRSVYDASGYAPERWRLMQIFFDKFTAKYVAAGTASKIYPEQYRRAYATAVKLMRWNAELEVVVAGFIYPFYELSEQIEPIEGMVEEAIVRNPDWHVTRDRGDRIIDSLRRAHKADHIPFVAKPSNGRTDFNFMNMLTRIMGENYHNFLLLFAIKMIKYEFAGAVGRYDRITTELRLYQTMAGRRVMNAQKAEIEDMILRADDLGGYESAAEARDQALQGLDAEAVDNGLKLLGDDLLRFLRSNGVEAQVSSRIKSINGFYIKTKVFWKYAPEDIPDTLGLRVISDDHIRSMQLIKKWVLSRSKDVRLKKDYEFKTEGWHNLDLEVDMGAQSQGSIRLELQSLTADAWRSYRQGEIKPAHDDYHYIEWVRRVLGLSVVPQPRPLPELTEDPVENYKRQYHKLDGRVYVPTYKFKNDGTVITEMDVVELAAGSRPMDFSYAQSTDNNWPVRLVKITPVKRRDSLMFANSIHGKPVIMSMADTLESGDLVLTAIEAMKSKVLADMFKASKERVVRSMGEPHTMLATATALYRQDARYPEWVKRGQRMINDPLVYGDKALIDDFARVVGFKSTDDLYASLGSQEKKQDAIYPLDVFNSEFKKYLRSDRQILPSMALFGARLSQDATPLQNAFNDLWRVRSVYDLTPDIVDKYFSDPAVGGAVIRSPVKYMWNPNEQRYIEVIDDKRAWSSATFKELFLEAKSKIHSIAHDRIGGRFVFGEDDRQMLERFYVLHFVAHQLFPSKPSKKVHKRGGGIPYVVHTVDATSTLYWELKQFTHPGASVIGSTGLAAELMHDTFEDTWLGELSDSDILSVIGLQDNPRAKNALMIARTMTRTEAEEEKGGDPQYYLRLISSIENEYKDLPKSVAHARYYSTLILKIADKLTSVRFDIDAVSDEEMLDPKVARSLLVFLNERMKFVKYFAAFLLRTENTELRQVALYWNDQYLNIFEAQKRRIAERHGDAFVEDSLDIGRLKPVRIRIEDEERHRWSAKGLKDGKARDDTRTHYQVKNVTSSEVTLEEFKQIWPSLRETYPPVWEKDWLKDPEYTWSLLTGPSSNLSARMLFAQGADGAYTVPAGISLYTHAVESTDQVRTTANTVDAVAVHPNYRGHGANHVLIEDLRRGPLRDKSTVDILSFATSLVDPVNRKNGYTTIPVSLIEEVMHIGDTVIEGDGDVHVDGARLANTDLINLALTSYRAGELKGARAYLELFAKSDESTLYELNAAIALIPWIVTDYKRAFALYYKLTAKYRQAAVQKMVNRSNLTQSQKIEAYPILVRLYGDSWLDRLRELRAQDELRDVSDRDLATLVNNLDLLKDGLTEAHIRINAKMMNDELDDVGPFLRSFQPSFWDRHLRAVLDKKSHLPMSDRLQWAIRYFQVVYDIRLSVPLQGKAQPKDIPSYKGTPAQIYSIDDLPKILDKLVEIDTQLASLPRKILLRSLTMRRLVIVKSIIRPNGQIAGFWEFNDDVDQNNIVLTMDYAYWKQVLFHEIGHSLHGPVGKFATYIDPSRFREYVSLHRSFFVSADPSFVQQIESVRRDEELDVPELAWKALSIIYKVRLEQWKRVRESEEEVRKLFASFGLGIHHAYPAPSMAARYVFEDPELATAGKEPFRLSPSELIAEYTQLYMLFPLEFRKIDHLGYDFFSAILGSTHDASRVIKLASNTPSQGARLSVQQVMSIADPIERRSEFTKISDQEKAPEGQWELALLRLLDPDSDTRKNIADRIASRNAPTYIFVPAESLFAHLSDPMLSEISFGPISFKPFDAALGRMNKRAAILWAIAGRANSSDPDFLSALKDRLAKDVSSWSPETEAKLNAIAQRYAKEGDPLSYEGPLNLLEALRLAYLRERIMRDRLSGHMFWLNGKPELILRSAGVARATEIALAKPGPEMDEVHVLSPVSRRDFLRLGAFAAASLVLPDSTYAAQFLQAEPAFIERVKRITSDAISRIEAKEPQNEVLPYLKKIRSGDIPIGYPSGNAQNLKAYVDLEGRLIVNPAIFDALPDYGQEAALYHEAAHFLPRQQNRFKDPDVIWFLGLGGDVRMTASDIRRYKKGLALMSRSEAESFEAEVHYLGLVAASRGQSTQDFYRSVSQDQSVSEDVRAEFDYLGGFISPSGQVDARTYTIRYPFSPMYGDGRKSLLLKIIVSEVPDFNSKIQSMADGAGNIKIQDLVQSDVYQQWAASWIFDVPEPVGARLSGLRIAELNHIRVTPQYVSTPDGRVEVYVQSGGQDLISADRIVMASSNLIIPEPDQDETDIQPIKVEGGQSFGHFLMPILVAMQKQDLRGLSVVEVGSGNGGLAVAALRLGAKRVVALENDPEKAALAQRTFAQNGVDAIFIQSDALSSKEDLDEIGAMHQVVYVIGDASNWFGAPQVTRQKITGSGPVAVIGNVGNFYVDLHASTKAYLENDISGIAFAVLGGYGDFTEEIQEFRDYTSSFRKNWSAQEYIMPSGPFWMSAIAITPKVGARLASQDPAPNSFGSLLREVRALTEKPGYDPSALESLVQQMFDTLPESWRVENEFSTLDPSKRDFGRGSLLLKALNISAAYGLSTPQGVEYWQEVERLLTIFNHDYLAHGRDPGYKSAHVGILTVQDLVLQTIGILRDAKMYVSASFQMDNIPEPYRYEVARADLAYSYAHAVQSQEGEDSMAMLPSVGYWLRKLSKDTVDGTAVNYERDLRGLIARGMLAYLVHDDKLVREADQNEIHLGGVMRRQEEVWRYLKQAPVNDLLTAWIEEIYEEPRRQGFDIRVYAHGQVDTVGLRSAGRYLIDAPFSELLIQNDRSDESWQDKRASLMNIGNEEQVPEAISVMLSFRWQNFERYRSAAIERLQSLKKAGQASDPGEAFSFAKFFGARLATSYAITPTGQVIPLPTFMPMTAAAGVSGRVRRGSGTYPMELDGLVYLLTRENVPAISSQEAALSKLLGQDILLESDIKDNERAMMKQVDQAYVFIHALNGLGVSTDDIHGVLQINLNRLIEPGSNDARSAVFQGNVFLLSESLKMIRDNQQFPLVKYYVYGHPELVSYAMSHGLADFQISEDAKKAEVFHAKITGATNDEVEEGKAYAPTASSESGRIHPIYPLLHYGLYLLAIQNVKETVTAEDVDPRVVSEVLRLAGMTGRDHGLMPDHIIAFGKGNADPLFLEMTASRFAVRSVIKAVGARLAEMVRTLKSLSTAA